MAMSPENQLMIDYFQVRGKYLVPGDRPCGGFPLDWYRTAQPPAIAQPQASAFANWVFEQSVGKRYVPLKRGRAHRLKLGQITHRDIELFLKLTWTRTILGRDSESDWVTEFCDNTVTPEKTFQATRLIVHGLPIRCVPDVVLRRRDNSKYMIIERKATFVAEPHIPADGWPNVEAQLWCYSWIDEWEKADEVLLVGQLWHRTRGGIALCHNPPVWKRSDEEHHRRCMKWFRRYGGESALSEPP